MEVCSSLFVLFLLPEPLFDLASYVNNPSLSDVVLISEDGVRFHAHRLVLCAQSPVFKSMMDSDLWVESASKEVCWFVLFMVYLL